MQAQPLPTIELSTSLEHFHAEAVRGQCDTGRYRCPYYVWGAGPPLVFIPGLCDDSLSFVMPIARLSRHFRCIAYDLPTGAGDGARLSRYRHRDLVEDLFALLDQLQIEQSYVFGASFGSTVALRALHDRPVRLPRGVLQGGFAYRPLAWGEVLLSSFARWWPWPMGKLPLRTELLKVSHEGPFARVDQSVWNFFLQRFGAPPMAAVAHRALLLHQLDLRPLLPEVQQPVLLIVGDQDPLVGTACENALRAGLPHASRAELDHCGHMPQFTHPELLAELVLRYLTPLACPR